MFAERGSHMVTIFETPAGGADDDYVDWYTGQVSLEHVDKTVRC
jgi:hypothetical protein